MKTIRVRAIVHPKTIWRYKAEASTSLWKWMSLKVVGSRQWRSLTTPRPLLASHTVDRLSHRGGQSGANGQHDALGRAAVASSPVPLAPHPPHSQLSSGVLGLFHSNIEREPVQSQETTSVLCACQWKAHCRGYTGSNLFPARAGPEE